MKVLSLFDGISCGMVALERAGIPVERYVAYEIEPNAIKISKKNYPQIEHCGDVTTADFTQYRGFDLVMGGSPCQNMSTLGDRTGLDGEKSRLFFEFARALDEAEPQFFLLENNANMPRKDKEKITEILGVKPIEINSKIFVPQNRSRLYWIGKKTHKRHYDTVCIAIPQTEKSNLYEVIAGLCKKIDLVPFVLRKIPELEEKYGYLPKMFNPYNATEIKHIAPCLTAQGNSQTKSCSIIVNNRDGTFSMPNSAAHERLQTLPSGYTEGVPEGIRKSLIGNGWTVDVIAHILKGLGCESCLNTYHQKNVGDCV